MNHAPRIHIIVGPKPEPPLGQMVENPFPSHLDPSVTFLLSFPLCIDLGSHKAFPVSRGYSGQKRYFNCTIFVLISTLHFPSGLTVLALQ